MHEGIYSRCVESGWGEKQPGEFELGPWMQNQAGRGRPKKTSRESWAGLKEGPGMLSGCSPGWPYQLLSTLLTVVLMPAGC